MQVRTATAVIGITALTMLLVAGMIPINSSGFVSTNYGPTPDRCSGSTITFSLPSGTYAPGAPLKAYISWNCGSSTKAPTSGGKWAIKNSMGVTVASGTFSCPDHAMGGCGTNYEFLPSGTTAPTTPGTYTFYASFHGQEAQSNMSTSSFTVTPEFPAGLILGVLAPFAALFGYVKLRKPSVKI